METIQSLKTVESKTKVRFPDCDPFNHLNNSKYIDYFINAREDQLLAFYNFDVHKMALDTGLSWVVAQNQIAYLSPAEIMEVVTIQTRLILFDEKSILIEGLMWDNDKRRLKAVMWSRQVHFNLHTKKSHPHSDELKALFNEMLFVLPDHSCFEERVQALKLESKSLK